MNMRLLKIFTSSTVRQHCTVGKPPSDVAKSIYLSECTDIFTNLALEDWIYRNIDFTDRHILMLWQNQPCIVIGRHQNPWLECNVAKLPCIANGAKLARRNSGGGTVYHDMGNLNMTFFTSRRDYSRRRNLELISRALEKSFGIHSHINKREDLCIADFKVSGTASKLGRTSAYHHCTILVDANKDDLSVALKNTLGDNVRTTASKSVKSKILNLSDVVPGITVPQVLRAIVEEFRDSFAEADDADVILSGANEDRNLNGVKVIRTVDELNFPGVTALRNTLSSEEWTFGKTPKFELFRNVINGDGGSQDSLDVFVLVEYGRVTNAGLKNDRINMSVASGNLEDLRGLFIALIDRTFSKDVLDEFEMIATGLVNSEKCKRMAINKI